MRKKTPRERKSRVSLFVRWRLLDKWMCFFRSVLCVSPPLAVAHECILFSPIFPRYLRCEVERPRHRNGRKKLTRKNLWSLIRFLFPKDINSSTDSNRCASCLAVDCSPLAAKRNQCIFFFVSFIWIYFNERQQTRNEMRIWFRVIRLAFRLKFILMRIASFRVA